MRITQQYKINKVWQQLKCNTEGNNMEYGKVYRSSVPHTIMWAVVKVGVTKG